MPVNSFKNKRILIVDSFKMFRDTLKLIIHSLGVKTIDTASSASQGLFLCKEKNYDIILMGYDLGEGRNGQQILEELRVNGHLKRSTIFLLITAESSQTVVLPSVEHKPDGYLIKPFTAKQLIQRLDAYSSKKKIMASIYQAMDDKNHELVLQYCDQHINENGKFINECLGIKSRQLFELERYDEAEVIYLSKKEEDHCQWASIGLGKIQLQRKEYQQALSTFESILRKYPLYLSAYDWIAEVYEAMAEFEQAEIALEKAIAISPHSVRRIKNYAEICKANNNLDKSLSAYKQLVALSKYSIHNTPENALSFAQTLVEHKGLTAGSHKESLYREAFKALSEMTKDFNEAEVKLKTKLVNACMHKSLNAINSARDSLDEADRLKENLGSNISNGALLNVAQSYKFFERDAEAMEILTQLASENQQDAQLLEKIDAIVDEPLSTQGKNATEHSVKIGINHYNQQEYELAIKEFSIAERKYPKHMGIKLNMMQALMMSYEQDPSRERHKERCQRYIEQLSDMSRRSDHYSRYFRIRDKFAHMLKEEERQQRSNARKA
jgi:tetratricopeptide (TPR) repeat protein